MTYAVRQATPQDVVAIIVDPSDQTRADMAAVDASPLDVICRYAPRAADPDSRAITKDGRLLAVFGWIKIRATWHCWFVAKQEYFSGAAGPVLASRRFLAETARRNPHVSLKVHLLVDGEKQRRWLTTLGMKQDLGGPTSFVYARPNSAVAIPDVAAPAYR